MKWVDDIFGSGLVRTDPVKIEYSLLNEAFGLEMETKHELCIVKGEGQTFLELDQYPEGAEVRPRENGALPPGVAITTMTFPDFGSLERHWAAKPIAREGLLYGGRKVGVLRTPDGALLEVVEG
jgi:hypothetical protein